MTIKIRITRNSEYVVLKKALEEVLEELIQTHIVSYKAVYF